MHNRIAARDSERIDILDWGAALSTRKRHVLDGFIAGKANKIVAYDLGITDRTVEIYRAKVMANMQATSLFDLVRMTSFANP